MTPAPLGCGTNAVGREAPSERNRVTPQRVLRKGWLLGVLLVAPFMAQADATIANVATPSTHADLVPQQVTFAPFQEIRGGGRLRGG